MNTAPYFKKRYHPDNYDCLAFVVEVWRELTGTDLREPLQNLLEGATARRKITRHTYAVFKSLDAPVDPCIVLMQAPYTLTHVGIWLRGRVFQITESGVEHTDLEVASRNHKTIRFITAR